MAQLSDDAERRRRAAERSCGSCSLCCSVLRVDELSKLAGRDCIHQREGAGCGIHDRRPGICRAYHCLWLQGGLEDDERPDLTGGVVDLEARGMNVGMIIHEAKPGAFDASPRLQAIAERHRASMPVRILDTADVLDVDRSQRVLLADGVEHRIADTRLSVFRDGELVEVRHQPFTERLVRRAQLWWQKRRLATR